MRSIVKVSWNRKDEGWIAELLTASAGGFERQGLQPGRSLYFEIPDEKRCTGYAPSQGERVHCPEFRKISSGSQCPECRGKDIYSDYVRGDRTDLDGKFSVYLAQIGDNVKVGVTRTGNTERRWVEQGADYAAEAFAGLSANEALDKEQEITDENGITQRIRKENKMYPASGPGLLEKTIDDLDYYADIVDVQEKTVYPLMEARKFARKGRFEGDVQSVKGQIVSNGRIAMALSSGRVMRNPRQKGLSEYG